MESGKVLQPHLAQWSSMFDNFDLICNEIPIVQCLAMCFYPTFQVHACGGLFRRVFKVEYPI